MKDMRMNIMKYIVLSACTILSAGLTSCFDKMSDNSVNGPLEISITKITVGKEAVNSYIGITARNAGWTLTGDHDWCLVSPTSGDIGTTQVTVTFTQNDTEEDRTTNFVIVSGGIQKEIQVEQLATNIVPPNLDPEYAINQEIHESIINEWYYWNAETETAAADYNQPYDKFFNSYLTYLTKNNLDGGIWDRNTTPYLYSYIKRTATDELGLPSLNYGMEFDIADYSVQGETRMVSRLLYVMDKSPAAKAGLKRGDWFWKVNNMQMFASTYNNRIDSLVKPVKGFSPKLGMLTFQAYAYNLIDNKVSTLVTPEHFQGSPILNAYLPPIERSDKNGNPVKTGYLVYNSFDPNYESDLIRAFGDLQAAKIDNLILDLRYNRSGTVEMAELMANLIVPPSLNGKVFAEYEFNSKQSAHNRTAVLQSHTNSVKLTTVYILTSGFTAGAAELLINGLRGIDEITLVVVGDQTEGMNVGQVKRAYKTADYEYDVYPVAFRCYNAKNEGDYRYGLSPNTGLTSEWDGDNVKWSDSWGWKGVAGKTEDPLLDKALNYIVGYSAMPGTEVGNVATRQKPGYPRTFSVQASMIMDIPE